MDLAMIDDSDIATSIISEKLTKNLCFFSLSLLLSPILKINNSQLIISNNLFYINNKFV